MTDAGRTQDNFILSSLPVVGLLLSKYLLDKMKLVCDHTIPIILTSGNNILVNMAFKISVWYTNFDTRKIQSRLGNNVCCLFIALKPIYLGTRQIISLLAKVKKPNFSITNIIKGSFSFILLTGCYHEARPSLEYQSEIVEPTRSLTYLSFKTLLMKSGRQPLGSTRWRYFIVQYFHVVS